MTSNHRHSDQELEQRLAKLKATGAGVLPSSDHDLALHFSKVFGHSPAATHLSPPLERPGIQPTPDERTNIGSDVPQRSMSSYFIPKDSSIGQDEIDRILADSGELLIDGDDQDDLGFLDTVDSGLSVDQMRELRETLSQDSNNKTSGRTGQQELEHVTRDLEETLSKFLQTHQAPRSAYASEASETSTEPVRSIDGAQAQAAEQDRAFGNQLDRIAGVSFTTEFTGADETSQLITQAREAAELEAKYGTRDKALLKSLTNRHDELKKGIQGLSSVREVQAAKRDNEVGLGPPPKAIDLNELRSGGSVNDENPDDWCCICNEDATWTCPGCDSDNYCQHCYRESHVGPDVDWEMKKHRPRPFVKK